MNEEIRKAFEEAGITDPAIKKQIWRQAMWNIPLVADNKAAGIDTTERVVKAIKDYREKHKGEDLQDKYHFRKVTFPCCGNCKYHAWEYGGMMSSGRYECVHQKRMEQEYAVHYTDSAMICDLYEPKEEQP